MDDFKKQFERFQNRSEARFKFIKDHLSALQKQFDELNEENTEFYEFIADQINDLDKRVS